MKALLFQSLSLVMPFPSGPAAAGRYIRTKIRWCLRHCSVHRRLYNRRSSNRTSPCKARGRGAKGGREEDAGGAQEQKDRETRRSCHRKRRGAQGMRKLRFLMRPLFGAFALMQLACVKSTSCKHLRSKWKPATEHQLSISGRSRHLAVLREQPAERVCEVHRPRPLPGPPIPGGCGRERGRWTEPPRCSCNSSLVSWRPFPMCHRSSIQ